MQNELVTIEKKQIPDVFVAGGLEPYIKTIRSHVSNIVPDISTDKGRKEIASMAYKVAKSKTYLDNIGKEYVATLKELPKVVDAERKRMRDELEALQEDVRKPLTEWETKEKQRIENLENGINDMVVSMEEVTANWDTYTLDAMRDYHDRVKRTVIDDSWQEYKEQAASTKERAMLVILAAIEKREKHDAEQAELARLRAEEEQRKKVEHEQCIAREAAERAKREAEEEAQRKAAEAEAKAQAEIKAAEERVKQAEREKQEAIERERQEAARVMREAEEKARREAEAKIKQEAEEKAKREAEAAAEAKRQANQEHRDNIEAEVIADLIALEFIPEDATALMNAINDGRIRHLFVKY